MRVSVCVPYWNRQPALTKMCEQYDQFYGDLDVEIVVADDGSPQPAVVPEGVKLVRLPAKDRPLNPCVPINAAVAEATGDVIVLTNPEVEHPEPVLERMLRALEKADYVAAPCWDVERKRYIAGPTVRYLTSLPAGAHFHFMAVLRRDHFYAAGGFDEDYRNGQGWEDADFLWRLARADTRFRLADVAVQHRSGARTRWSLPSNAGLFYEKWPQLVRR